MDDESPGSVLPVGDDTNADVREDSDGWAELSKHALRSEEFQRLTAYLIETGKAAAD